MMWLGCFFVVAVLVVIVFSSGTLGSRRPFATKGDAERRTFDDDLRRVDDAPEPLDAAIARSTDVGGMEVELLGQLAPALALELAEHDAPLLSWRVPQRTLRDVADGGSTTFVRHALEDGVRTEGL